MKRIILTSLMLLFYVSKTQSQNIIANNECTNQFVGSWNWIKNNVYKDCFYITIGERNDSLLFSISGVFYGGRKIHGPNYDNNYNLIADVRTVIPKGNKAIGKISDTSSDFHSDPNKKPTYYPVSFELLNDTTMLFILDDNKAYWPDTAIMRRRDYVNHKFSFEEDYYLHNGE